MKVMFSQEALSDERSFRHISAITWMFADGRHKWVVHDVQQISESPWLQTESDSRRRAIKQLAAISARSTHSPDVVVAGESEQLSHNGRQSRCPSSVAELALRQPVCIVVENAECDGLFLRNILLRVGSKHIKRAIGDEAFARLNKRWSGPLGDNEWLEIRHGGGQTTAKQVEFACSAEPRATRRVLAFVDSDRNSPTAPIGSTAQHVQNSCQTIQSALAGAAAVQHVVLRKREVENYFPREALHARNSAAVKQWDMFTDQQKDYEDLKAGVLFGSRLWRAVIDHDHLFHERSLRERAGENDELDTIVKIVAGMF